MPDPRYATPPPVMPPPFFPPGKLAPDAPAPDAAAPPGTRPATWEDIITATAKKSPMDPRLPIAVAQAESSMRANPPPAADDKGARGIMQLMPATAARWKVNMNDPVDVIRGGVQELKSQLDQHGGDVTLALRRYYGSPQAPDALTEPYVQKVFSLLQPSQPSQSSQPSQPPDQPAAPAAQPPHAQTLWERLTGTTTAVPADVQAEMSATARRTAPAPPPPPQAPADAHPGDWATKANIEAAVAASNAHTGGDPNAPPEPWWARGLEGARTGVSNLLLGGVKGAANTALRVGGAGVDLATNTPGLAQTALDVAAPGVQPALEPHGAMQHVGQFGEQAAELWAPSEMLADLSAKTAAILGPRLAPYVGTTLGKVLPRMAVEGLGGGAMAGAQGGDVKTGAVLGAAAAPVIAGASAAKGAMGDLLENKAVKLMTQALDPTKERFKAIAKRIVPEMLQRGVWGSREHLAELSAEKMSEVGQQLDAHLQKVTGNKMFTKPIWETIEQAKNVFRTTVYDKHGTPSYVDFDSRAIEQLDKLKTTIQDLGKTATVDQVIAARQAWDKIVNQAGGFAHRAGGAIGVPLADSSEAAAERTADSIIRQELARLYPERVPLNKDYWYWKNLNDVVEQTMDRKMPQGAGITRTVAKMLGQGLGAIGGFHYGGISATFPAGYAIGKGVEAIDHIVTSPLFRSGSAVLRNKAARLLTAGDSMGWPGSPRKSASSAGRSSLAAVRPRPRSPADITLPPDRNAGPPPAR